MRKIFKFITSRIFFVLLAFLFQTVLYVGMAALFRDYFVYFYVFEIFIRLVAIIYIVNDTTEPAYKIAWLILIMFMPYLGSFFYLFLAGGQTTKFFKRKFNFIANRTSQIIKKDELSSTTFAEINEKYPRFKSLCSYINRYGGFPVYKNEETVFFSTGEEYFEDLKKELKKARKFIFMEYFIIEKGKMWGEILEILKEKANEGVEIKIIYDDFGCINRLPVKYPAYLEKFGIEAKVFNPVRHIINVIYNNRDHRKITVIDGKTAFTGGINLADEYINAVTRFGHWKDYGVKFTGAAVWNFSAAFLSMWEFCSRNNKNIDYKKYKVHHKRPKTDLGYVIPFADSPFDGEVVAENVYNDIINKAQNYVYITTPYLILDNRTAFSLVSAAKRGVDIRIMTPRIPDKKIVFQVTRSNYEELIKSGVRIYEYTPGFIHAKSIIADDEVGVVGSINLDYRSLYLHCENGLLMFRVLQIADIKRDIFNIMAVSEEITDPKKFLPLKIVRGILNVFAPLM
ncbi:MAG: cardiolipin synthase [Clostridiales bacterium]|nr:cardiolipin synthase [Clostridiales bacterium]